MQINAYQILAHRGLWEDRKMANSKKAIISAFENGFGLETDIRDGPGSEIYISHDPFVDSEDTYTLSFLLEMHQKISPESIIALNIKSDGLFDRLKYELKDFPSDKYFLFDMSVPDLLLGSKKNLNLFCRASYYEDPCPFQDITAGVWIDCFNDKFPQGDTLLDLINQWPNIAFVSPELHARSHENFWHKLKDVLPKAPTSSCIMLCTDYPLEAKLFFN